MLDDVERRAFLIKPAGKNAAPAIVRLLDVELDERAGQPLILPWRAGLARPQANHRITHAKRLPRPQPNIADDAVALVEQPQDRNSLGHRGDSGDGSGRAGHVDGDGVRDIDRGRVRTRLVTCAKQQQRCGRDC